MHLLHPIGHGLFLLLLLGIAALDIALVVSLIRPGDERRQLIVWKASASTLAGVAGYLILRVALNFLRGYQSINPFTLLAVLATLYFVFLLYHRARLGG
ncbi:hypothetical protein [Intestinimonas sp.]|uniref:hypothetical protein n=1 Tax=Intestinimonas sp. TaxID=1965293 RepID=UPI00261B0788|nr:hypothetical protein [Intestinimonas sp.]